MKFLTMTAAAALLFGIGTANANILFQLGNHPQADEQNVFFDGGETGLTLTSGHVGQAPNGPAVNFTTLGNPAQILRQDSNGQAQIFCFGGCVDNSAIHQDMGAQLASISMRAGVGTAWTDAIINLENGTGDALVTVTDNLGQPFQYTLGTGQNFLTMVAEPGSGEFITRIDVTSAIDGQAFGFDQFKQPRVSGACELVTETSCTPIIIEASEPGSLALLGVGMIGTGFAIRRRQRRDGDNLPMTRSPDYSAA